MTDDRSSSSSELVLHGATISAHAHPQHPLLALTQFISCPLPKADDLDCVYRPMASAKHGTVTSRLVEGCQVYFWYDRAPRSYPLSESRRKDSLSSKSSSFRLRHAPFEAEAAGARSHLTTLHHKHHRHYVCRLHSQQRRGRCREPKI